MLPSVSIGLRLDQHLDFCNKLLAKSRVVSGLRVVFFFIFLGLLWFVFGPVGWPWELVVIAGILFFALLVTHEVVHRRISGARLRISFLDWSLARLGNRWQGEGVSGAGMLAANHPYACDLDILGPGSLFESVCIARTQSGRKLLAAWLGAPGEIMDVKIRQEAVSELAPALDSRLDLVEKSGSLQSGHDLAPTLRWAALRIPVIPMHWIFLAIALGCANLITLGIWLSGVGDSLPFTICLIFSMLIYGSNWKFIWETTTGLDHQVEALLAAKGGLDCLAKTVGWESCKLRGLQACIGKKPGAVSAVECLVTLVQTWHARKNPLVTIPLVLVFWDLIFAWFLGKWHRRHAKHLVGWIDALAEYEALQCLAHQSYLYPSEIFPTLLNLKEPWLEALDLGHPLLQSATCVKNKVQLAPPKRLLLISGSNMSGKSTYLRSVGVAAVMAWAGGTVRASAMSLSRVQVYGALHAEDSLRMGMSRFAAELARMRSLLEFTRESTPVLFLLDEIFSGTNSSDRQAGAEALILRLVAAGSLGMVTTHDLALAKIADDLQEKAQNVHFIDTWHGKIMSFDYLLRPGVVPRSNAIGLMRAIGMDV